MRGAVDERLLDEALVAELEMTTNLVIAANQSDGPLTQEQVDATLGLTCPDAGPPPFEWGPSSRRLRAPRPQHSARSEDAFACGRHRCGDGHGAAW